jgi:hypothetical protein
MRLVKLIAALAFGALISGCASIDTPSRNASFGASQPPRASVAGEFGDPAAKVMPDYKVVEVNVTVPETLRVSEANSYLPKGDIVWREDPPGDRYSQVAAIVQDAMNRGTANVQGTVPVIVDVKVEKFHALTEKTRYSVGGIHSIRFILSIRSAQTGLLLEEPRAVQADMIGYGGDKAIAAERVGQTQKVRITDFLAHVIETELTSPDGFQNPRLGFIQILNHQA